MGEILYLIRVRCGRRTRGEGGKECPTPFLLSFLFGATGDGGRSNRPVAGISLGERDGTSSLGDLNGVTYEVSLVSRESM